MQIHTIHFALMLCFSLFFIFVTVGIISIVFNIEMIETVLLTKFQSLSNCYLSQNIINILK